MEVLRRHISVLANLPETGAPVVSAFLDLRKPIESVRASFLLWSTAARSALPREQRPMFDAARAEVQQVLKRQWDEPIQSVAVFARVGEPALHTVIPFQATLETHFDVAPRPAIFPLVQMKDRFHRFVVAISTEDTARIFEISLGAVTEEILTRKPEMAASLGRGLSREHYHHRRQEQNRRFHREQVEIIENLMTRRGINHLILAGLPRHVAALRAMLPKAIQNRIAGSVFRAPNGHDFSPVIEQALHTFIEAEQCESRGTVERLHEQIRRRGLATGGIHACRSAILAGTAAELVISEELSHPDREELVRLATACNLPIEVCEGDDLLLQYGGVGCLLRYRIDEPVE